jgi:hypothetical protein
MPLRKRLTRMLCGVQVKRARFETLRQFVGGQRLADEPSLYVVTSHLGEQRALRFRFDALGNEFEVECLGESDHRADNRLIVSRG